MALLRGYPDDAFAGRAALARGRTARNTYLSLEHSVRAIATSEERAEAERREPQTD